MCFIEGRYLVAWAQFVPRCTLFDQRDIQKFISVLWEGVFSPTPTFPQILPDSWRCLGSGPLPGALLLFPEPSRPWCWLWWLARAHRRPELHLAPEGWWGSG